MTLRILILVVAASFAGCGFKGPLYLPPPRDEAQRPPPSDPTPQAAPQLRPIPSEAAPPPQ